MHADPQTFLRELDMACFYRQQLTYVSVENPAMGAHHAKAILNHVLTPMSMVYLSGGTTPKHLYAELAHEEKIRPGAVGLIDERYGDPMHEQSNARMINETGLTRYLSIVDIPFYTVLKGKSIEETTMDYDELIRSLQTVYTKSVGILGIGQDGHIAGIAPNRSQFENPLFSKEHAYDMVSWFDDHDGSFKKRITMTFLGLSMLDLLIVLVFGKEKATALQAMFEEGSEEQVPARFLIRPDIAKKTLLITDQQIA